MSLKLYDLKVGMEKNFDGGGKWFVESGLAVGRRMEYERVSSEMKLAYEVIASMDNKTIVNRAMSRQRTILSQILNV